jgi:hypothetical protein
MLRGAEESHPTVVSWLSHGKAFLVHNPEEFVATVMPLYFRQTHYKSFQRQLNLWGFERIGRGPEVGAYYHEVSKKNHPRKPFSNLASSKVARVLLLTGHIPCIFLVSSL